MSTKYREFASQTCLQDAIECFWAGETPPFDTVQRVLPDDCADILFSRGAENRSAGRWNDETLRRFPTAAGPAARRECQFFHSLIAPRRYSVAMKITPLLYMDAIEPSLEFWAGKLGFEKTAEAPEGGFVILQKDGAELMLQTRESLAKDIPQMLDYARSSSGLLFIEVDDFNAMLKHVEGLKVVLPERTAVYGMREIIVLEPGGNPVCFAAPVAK